MSSSFAKEKSILFIGLIALTSLGFYLMTSRSALQNNEVPVKDETTLHEETSVFSAGVQEFGKAVYNALRREETKTVNEPEAVLEPLSIVVGVHAAHGYEVLEFESRTGTSVDIVAVHIHWGNERDFPSELGRAVLDRGATLMIFWNPMDYRVDTNGQSDFHYRNILNGDWDEYIDAFVSDVEGYRGNVIIAPLEEVNGEWVHWSGVGGAYGTREEYLATYRYLREKFLHVQNVTFAWVINHVSVPDSDDNAITRYYPGDAYVDVIGINAFNFGTPWIGFDTLVRRVIQELILLEKPILISSTASAEGPLKPAWIEALFQSGYFRSGVLEGFLWFNENKEKNWLVWSDDASEAMFASQIEKIEKRKRAF